MATVAFAPGRVNLIGDHTDYSGGLVLPMAIQLGTTVTFEAHGDRVHLSSDHDPDPADLALTISDPASVRPVWARYVAAVIAEVRPSIGGAGRITTTLPIGAGLSSSAALEVAVALALGCIASPVDMALSCQRAEQRASGVPCGLMDQLVSAAGVEGHALLIDCGSNQWDFVPVPAGCDIVAVHSGQPRTLAGSDYASRRSACEAAAAVVGPLRLATPGDLRAISDSTIRRRARHVVTENHRVLAFATAMQDGDLTGAGALMEESHRSLRDDFEVSTPALDRLVESLLRRPGVHGARMTGAGFGGCVVALTEPGALDEGWKLRACAGARLTAPSPPEMATERSHS